MTPSQVSIGIQIREGLKAPSPGSIQAKIEKKLAEERLRAEGYNAFSGASYQDEPIPEKLTIRTEGDLIRAINAISQARSCGRPIEIHIREVMI